jgi:hypothetical protein
MRRPNDYPDEMDRPDPRMVDTALEGRETGDLALDRAAKLVADVRHVLLAPPGPETVARHVAAMTAAARSEDRWYRPVRRAGRPGRRSLRGVALAAALVVGAGVAGAVTLPDRGSDRAGQAVPAPHGRAEGEGQSVEPVEPTGDPAEQSGHGREVADVAHDDSLRGCEKGRAVSDVASSNAEEHGPKQDPCTKGEEVGGGQEGSAKGKTTSQQAQSEDHRPPETPGSQGEGHGNQGRDAGRPAPAAPPTG